VDYHWSIVLLILLTLGVVRLVQGPDLGSKFSYIGKYNSSCDWVGAVISIGFCRPQEEYFFETDMNVADLKAYFKEFLDPAYSGVELTFRGSFQDFIIFYHSSKEIAKKYNLSPPQKKHIISIRDFHSSEAQRSR
jgi:hypothetical protein